MQRSPRTAAVRLTLWTLLIAAFAMALVQPVQGGTEAAPEIQDPADDQAILGEIPQSETGGALDILSVWIANETATEVMIHWRLSSTPSGGAGLTGTPAGDVMVGQDTYTAAFTIAGTAYEATTVFDGGVGTPGGVASAVVVGETMFSMTILKSAIGDPAAGATLTAFTVEASRGVAPVPVGLISDDAAASIDYTFTGGSGGSGPNPDDTDGDGLNDTCEQTYFGDLSHNATEDADGDGLTNGQECALGTDPTKADTDGDGVNDKDDPFPTDPTRGGSSSNTTTSSTSSTTSRTSTTTSRSSTTTSSSSSTTGDDDDVESFGDAVDKLKGDPGYIALSSGGFLAVLVLAIIGLAVRWSL